MREVSGRVVHFTLDLARTRHLDEKELTLGLRSVAVGADGKDPEWVDWGDFVEVIERLERALGGPEPLATAFRAVVPVGMPELRALAAVFVQPIPFFDFFITRFMRTMYKNVQIDEIERLDGDRIRWTQTIPEPYRASETFHRGAGIMCELIPRMLDLPEAKILEETITPRSASFTAQFPPTPSLLVRGGHALSSTKVLMAAQLDEAFAKIGEVLRGKAGSTSPPTAAPTASADIAGWVERLALSPRQRDVFLLLVEGRANKDIAAALSCSERNVEFHVGRILRAARVSSRAELLVKVLSTR